MHIGLQVNNFSVPGAPEAIGPTLGRIARGADAAGLHSFWVMDHFFQIPNLGEVDQEMLEGWSALAFVAGQTERIRLGTMVTGVTYRYPALLVKTATTLDMLSGGRTYFGIGAAWFEREHQGLGVPFPSLKERFERLEETLQIAHQMWAGDSEPYFGRHYTLAEPINVPNSIQRPHPPILIGGTGEQKTLRFVAKYGDACNLFDRLGMDMLRHKLEVLRGHCEVEGRPYEEIEKTSLGRIALSRDGAGGSMSPSAAIEYFQGLAEVGIDHALVSFADPWNPLNLEILGSEVVPAVEKIVPAGRQALV